ncbi:MAG: hypothetical protein NTX57_10040 [Armatimonadetes bacterium]|nr:hypothetical protein [Armatimonadota bacterium]
MAEFVRFRQVYEAIFYQSKTPLQWAMDEVATQAARLLVDLNDYQYEGMDYVTDDGLENWYALSRVHDMLVCQLYGKHSRELTKDAYVIWWEWVGLTTREPSTYHPFWHEIVELIEDDTLTEPVQIEYFFWPALTFGELLFARAGVRVRVQPELFIKTQAERHTLFFTFTRSWRPTEDLSKGWGSNSQWRTDFRRDYATKMGYWFNRDGRCDLTPGHLPSTWSPDDCFSEELSYEEHVELLVNRCFVRTPKPDKSYCIEECRLFVPYENAKHLR